MEKPPYDFVNNPRKEEKLKEYCDDNNDGVDWRHKTKFPHPLLTAIKVEVQRFNSRMIVERQPHQINLIEPAFVKCKVGVERKMEESKSLNEIAKE